MLASCLRPDVSGLQQTPQLELLMGANDFGTFPVNGLVMGSHMFHQGRLGQVPTCRGSSVLIQSVVQCICILPGIL